MRPSILMIAFGRRLPLILIFLTDLGRTQKPVEVQKTLPHALSRAAASGAVEVGPGRLSNVLKTYAVTQDKVGTARTRMDEDIRCVRMVDELSTARFEGQPLIGSIVASYSKNFLQPWSATLNSSIQAAMKARQNVTKARCVRDTSFRSARWTTRSRN